MHGSGIATGHANADNQIAVANQFVYDGSGNPTTYRGAALTFDPENRMTQYGSVLSCGYTADGLRAWKQNASGTTYFLYDAAPGSMIPVCELSATGAVTATNTKAGMALVSRNSGGSSTFYSFDPQGSTAQRLSSAGAVLTSSETDAFGQTAGAASGDPYSGYCAEYGYFADAETGLLLLGHRYYDSGTGRFINRDPMGYAGGVDLYGYCYSSPNGGIDPAGFSTIKKIWDVCAVVICAVFAFLDWVLMFTLTLGICEEAVGATGIGAVLCPILANCVAGACAAVTFAFCLWVARVTTTMPSGWSMILAAIGGCLAGAFKTWLGPRVTALAEPVMGA